MKILHHLKIISISYYVNFDFRELESGRLTVISTERWVLCRSDAMGNSPDTYTQMLPQLSEILTQALTTKMRVKLGY